MSALVLGVVAAVGLSVAVPVVASQSEERPTCEGKPATVVGTSGNDSLVGTPAADVVVGLGGNDGISGLGGDDVLCGGSGADDVQGGDGADLVDGGPDADDLRGGPGVDTLSYRHAAAGVTVNLLEGIGADGEHVRDVEDVIGSAYADTIIGSDGGNRLVGLDGMDFLFGYGGSDQLVDGVRRSADAVRPDPVVAAPSP